VTKVPASPFTNSQFAIRNSPSDSAPSPRFSDSPWSICNLQCDELLPCSRAQRCPPATFPLPSAFWSFTIRYVLLAAFCLLPTAFCLLPSAFWSFTIRYSQFAIAPASVPQYAVSPLPATRRMVTCVPFATRALSSPPGRRPAVQAGPVSERAEGCPA